MADEVLETDAVKWLATVLEEATRANEERVRHFVEPAEGTLSRALSRRHHIVFGRRGSGKSSLLRKAAADLALQRKPIAYIDLETFKDQSYPDVLLNVLIETFSRYAEWLDTAAIVPTKKTTWWKKFFGRSPSKPALDSKQASTLAIELKKCVTDLRNELLAEDQAAITIGTTTESSARRRTGGEISANVHALAGAKYGEQDIHASKASRQVNEAYVRSKIQFLMRRVLEYQRLFREIARFSDGDAYLFLDDLYHLARRDQPHLIDYFHRIAKSANLWLKIGSIRHRSNWYSHGDPPIGLKLGDDADEIDLDLTLEKFSIAKAFLGRVVTEYLGVVGIGKLSNLVNEGAANRLVLASGGVARDYINILRRSISTARERMMAQRGADAVGTEDVNNAAGPYELTKREELKRDVPDEQDRLERRFNAISEFCKAGPRCNIFLLDKDERNQTYTDVQELVDLRLIHKISSRVTVRERKGHIFEAYMLDISQYTAARKIKNFEIIEFWKPDSTEKLRRPSMIFIDSTDPILN